MEGHVSRDCSMEQKAKSCYRCGQEGHIVRCLSSITLSCDLIAMLFYSRVIVLNLKAALAALEGPVVAVVVVVLARNAIAAARSATLRARAPKHPEVAQEATGGVAEGEEEEEEEATVALGAVKKHGALSPVLSCRRAQKGY